LVSGLLDSPMLPPPMIASREVASEVMGPDRSAAAAGTDRNDRRTDGERLPQAIPRPSPGTPRCVRHPRGFGKVIHPAVQQSGPLDRETSQEPVEIRP
jgi:hypothetical protein